MGFTAINRHRGPRPPTRIRRGTRSPAPSPSPSPEAQEAHAPIARMSVDANTALPLVGPGPPSTSMPGSRSSPASYSPTARQTTDLGPRGEARAELPATATDLGPLDGPRAQLPAQGAFAAANTIEAPFAPIASMSNIEAPSAIGQAQRRASPPSRRSSASAASRRSSASAASRRGSAPSRRTSPYTRRWSPPARIPPTTPSVPIAGLKPKKITMQWTDGQQMLLLDKRTGSRIANTPSKLSATPLEDGSIDYYTPVPYDDASHIHWRSKLGRLLADSAGMKEPERFVLRELPDGYKLWRRLSRLGDEKRDPRDDSLRQDIYLYGFPRANRQKKPSRFDSPEDFMPHFDWLRKPERECPCRLCLNLRKLKSGDKKTVVRSNV